jgi:O-acetyl-ADP-ribose deacetylase (regulator of RNase III)
MHLIVRPGSVVDLEVDAIVNAANTRLANGGGLAGAISRAAGPQLDADCRRVAPCPTGDVRVTPGYQLPATYVIHAVGPIWRGDTDGA